MRAWIDIGTPDAARTHKVALHRSSVRGMVTGALLIAGFFTFPFGRLLGLQGKRLRERCAWALEWTGLAERATSRSTAP